MGTTIAMVESLLLILPQLFIFEVPDCEFQGWFYDMPPRKITRITVTQRVSLQNELFFTRDLYSVIYVINVIYVI